MTSDPDILMTAGNPSPKNGGVLTVGCWQCGRSQQSNRTNVPCPQCGQTMVEPHKLGPFLQVTQTRFLKSITNACWTIAIIIILLLALQVLGWIMTEILAANRQPSMPHFRL